MPRISELDDASPLTGSELVPVSQGAETVKITVDDLRSGSGGDSGTAPAVIFVNSVAGHDANSGVDAPNALATMIEARKRIGDKNGDTLINIVHADIYALDGWESQRKGTGKVTIQAPTSLRQVVLSELEVTAYSNHVVTEFGDDYEIQTVTVDAELTPGAYRGMVLYGAAANADPNALHGMDDFYDGKRTVIIDNDEDTLTIIADPTMLIAVEDLVTIGYPTTQLTSNYYRPFVGGKSQSPQDQFLLRHIEIFADGIASTSSISTFSGTWVLQNVTLQPSRTHNFIEADVWGMGVGTRFPFNFEEPETPPAYTQTNVQLQFCRGKLYGYLGSLGFDLCGPGGLYATGDGNFYLAGAVHTFGCLDHTNINAAWGFQNHSDYWGFPMRYSTFSRSGALERPASLLVHANMSVTWAAFPESGFADPDVADGRVAASTLQTGFAVPNGGWFTAAHCFADSNDGSWSSSGAGDFMIGLYATRDESEVLLHSFNLAGSGTFQATEVTRAELLPNDFVHVRCLGGTAIDEDLIANLTASFELR